MKKYQAKKVLSVLLTLLMVLSSINVGLSVIAFAAEPVDLPTANAASGTDLTNGQLYKVTTDVTIKGGTNGLNIPANATVIIDIAEGVTLTVKGSDANGTTAGKPGILMNSGSKLIFTGSGALVVTGGKGADGAAGGSSSYANNSTSNGGSFGKGGAGGGAGIGTNGGGGGTTSGATGSAGTTWPNNASVTITGVAYTGAKGADGSAGANGQKGGGNGCGGAGGGGGAGKGGVGRKPQRFRRKRNS